MFLRLFLLFTLIPVVEIWLLVRIGARIGAPATIALVLGTGALGALLARREGVRVLLRVQQEMAGGRPPTTSLVDAALVFVAGVVLVTPGILTDLAGLALLIPAVRRAIRRWVWNWLKRRVVMIHHQGVDPLVDADSRETVSGGPADEAGGRRESRGGLDVEIIDVQSEGRYADDAR